MADPSFDVVSKVDHQEVDNALNTAGKELATRYDFKGTDTTIKWSGDNILIDSTTEDRALAALEVFKEKAIKRGLSMKAFEAGEPKLSGKEFKLSIEVKSGLSSENAKKVTKLIKEEGFKGVQAAIQGEAVRISGKKKDDLQAVQQLLREASLDFAVQFENYR